MNKSAKLILQSVTTVAVLLGSTGPGVAQDPPGTVNPGTVIFNTFSQGTIDTSNCNKSTTYPPGVCQSGNDNGGAGPNLDNIQASVSLCEVDGRLTGSGSGTGFIFGKTYVSLIYRNGNVATCSRSPDDLTPLALTSAADPRVDSDFGSMMLGFWVVKPDRSATLTIAKQATLIGIQNYGSVSVREVQAPHRSFNVLNDPAPQINALRACGSLKVVGTCSTAIRPPCLTPECL